MQAVHGEELNPTSTVKEGSENHKVRDDQLYFWGIAAEMEDHATASSNKQQKQRRVR
jgi:hypothetical protein